MSRFLLCLLTLILVSSSLNAQAGVDSRRQKDLALRQLQNVRIRKQTVGSLLSELSLSYGVPIGFEAAPSDGELGNYQLDFKKGTLAELLTQFVADNDRYTWEISEGVVNIVPKTASRDFLLQSVLEVKINAFQIKAGTSCSELAESLFATPEVNKLLVASGATYRHSSFSGFYIPQIGRDFTLNVTDSTVRSVLNGVVAKSPTAKFWVLSRNSDGTLSLGLSAIHEGMPHDRKFSEQDLGQTP